MLFDCLLTIVAAASGFIAAIVGFGIGSLLTPIKETQVGLKLAVAVVSIPHFIGTAARFWQMRRSIDRHLLRTFGIASAMGGLIGALLSLFLQSAILTGIFSVLLIYSGIAGLTGQANRIRFHGWAAWAAGALSGLFGGLVGNQGGIRSAALLGVGVSRDAFVATATAVALMVDGARMPIYLATNGAAIAEQWPRIAWMTIGVIAGTLLGRKMLDRISETAFRSIVSAVILVLGLYMGFQAWNDWSAV